MVAQAVAAPLRKWAEGEGRVLINETGQRCLPDGAVLNAFLTHPNYRGNLDTFTESWFQTEWLLI